MYFKVVEAFGPSHGRWAEFANDHWIHSLETFDSIDGIVCPDVFEPKTEEDWEHCVNADFCLNLITDENYARKVLSQHPGSRLIGVVESQNCDHEADLLGYDIIDEYNVVSLITNWGPHDNPHPLSGFEVKSNGLIESFAVAKQAASYLQHQFRNDDHAKGAKVWSIFNVGA